MNVPQRHGCLTAWLYLIIIGGTFGLIGLMFASQFTPASHGLGYHPLSPQTLWAIAACTLVSMACAVGLFLLKRWAFYGYVLVQLVLVWINFSAGMDVLRSLMPLLQIAFLIGVMQIGGRYKGWGRLR